jgi:hypothetical protein
LRSVSKVIIFFRLSGWIICGWKRGEIFQGEKVKAGSNEKIIGYSRGRVGNKEGHIVLGLEGKNPPKFSRLVVEMKPLLCLLLGKCVSGKCGGYWYLIESCFVRKRGAGLKNCFVSIFVELKLYSCTYFLGFHLRLILMLKRPYERIFKYCWVEGNILL